MGLVQEENFPRGGRKPVKRTHDEIKEKRVENLFSTATNNLKRKKRDRKPKNDNRNALPHVNSKMEVKSVDILSYEKIVDGTLLLGCVHSIHLMSLQIGLPGRIFGNVTIKHISSTYLSNISRQIEENNAEELAQVDLPKLFHVGQMLPVKLLMKEGSDRGYKLHLSTDPKHINAEYNHLVVRKGMVLWASVSEKSDHCYILDAGIANCRIVLPFKAMDEGVEYTIGQPLWCSVRKSDVLKEATTATVSTKHAEVSKQMTSEETPLSRLIPGMQVEFEVQKVSKNGLIGKILKDVVGHVNQLYLKNPMDSLRSYTADTILTARVLYIEPITKFVKLILRETDGQEQPVLSIGAIQTATVIANSGRGLSLRLAKQSKGFTTYKRILNSVPHKENVDIKDLIDKKYPMGSNHQCRILCYNAMEMEYICTFEAAIIKETIFTEADIQFGQVLQGKISKVQEDGLEIKVGHVTGFVPNMHICNAQFSTKVKSKFKVGQIVKTKLFQLFKNSKKFTLKQTFIESESCLSKYEDAKVNSQHPGIIVKLTSKGALVLFYGDVKGWLLRKFEDGVYSFDPAMFYEGQVIFTTIVRIERDNRITLSLDPPKDKNTKDDNDSGVDTSSKKKSKRKRNKKKSKTDSNKTVPNNTDENKAAIDNSKTAKPDKTTKKSEKNKKPSVIKNVETSDDEKLVESNNDESDEEMVVESDEMENSEEESDEMVVDEESDEDLEGEESDEDLEGEESDKNLEEEEESDEDPEVESEDEAPKVEDPEIKSENDSDEEVKIENSKQNKKTKATNLETTNGTSEPLKMPGMQNFFELTPEIKEESDSSSEDESQNAKKPRKIKLKPGEVGKKLLEEEERLIKTEIKLADEPSLQTPKEIERALVSDPQNSKLWVLFIATLTSSGEIDKARGMAKKALETIPLEKVAERLNVWIAYLNLENSFGDETTFKEVFSEAITRNDPLKVHLVVIEMLMESKKFEKMEEMIRIVKRKFKQNPDVYLKLAKIYYLCLKYHEARLMQSVAVKYVTRKKEQVDMLVQFAILEFKHGDSDYAESVFETILQTDPTRTDVWCTYADQLVNQKKIDFARKVYTRAANTKLPLKKKKVILTKFHKFEKSHGSPQDLEDFKQLCTKYSENI